MTNKFSCFLAFSLLLFGCGQDIDYRLKIFGLSEGELVEADSVSFSFIVSPEDWIDRGYSVHFLLDRHHLLVKKDRSDVDYRGLTPGAHVVTAMVCDENGVALRSPSSVDIRNFYSRRLDEPLIYKKSPILILHMPQDTLFVGEEANRILLDFLVLNAELGEGYRVHYELDGLDYYVESQDPIWIENANRIGEHELKVSLETQAGNPVIDNPFNQITKMFLVRER